MPIDFEITIEIIMFFIALGGMYIFFLKDSF